MKRFAAWALLLSFGCSRGTDDLSSVSGAAEMTMPPDATASTDTMQPPAPADAAPAPAPTPTTTTTIETVQSLQFGEPTYGEPFTDPVEPTPTCYTYEGSGADMTSCDGPQPPPAVKWVNFSIDDTFEEVKKTKHSDTRELWVSTWNGANKWKESKARGTEFTHLISFGAKFTGEVKEGAKPLIDSRFAGPDIRNANVTCKASSNVKKVIFDNVKESLEAGLGAGVGLSIGLISVDNLIDVGAAWGDAWETTKEKTFTFAAEITDQQVPVMPGDDVTKKCEDFWKKEVPVVSALLADRVKKGWPALLTVLPQSAKCSCTSKNTIYSYNQCRGDTTGLKDTDHIIKQLQFQGPFGMTGTWDSVDALQKCNTNEWKQAAIVGMRADCSQTWTFKGDSWNDWCRQNWPNTIEKYYRWWYQGSLRKDCNTITPESLTCGVTP